MTQDVFVGLMVLLVSSGLCLLFILTGARHGNFPSAPFYVRFGIILWAGMLLWRGVDLIQLAEQPEAMPGHVDAKSVLATLALVYLVGSLVWWVAAKKLPAMSWIRLRHAFGAVSAHPEIVVVALTPHEVAEELRLAGTPTVEPLEGPEAVFREGVRAPRRADRRA